MQQFSVALRMAAVGHLLPFQQLTTCLTAFRGHSRHSTGAKPGILNERERPNADIRLASANNEFIGQFIFQQLSAAITRPLLFLALLVEPPYAGC